MWTVEECKNLFDLIGEQNRPTLFSVTVNILNSDARFRGLLFPKVQWNNINSIPGIKQQAGGWIFLHYDRMKFSKHVPYWRARSPVGPSFKKPGCLKDYVTN